MSGKFEDIQELFEGREKHGKWQGNSYCMRPFAGVFDGKVSLFLDLVDLPVDVPLGPLSDCSDLMRCMRTLQILDAQPVIDGEMMPLYWALGKRDVTRDELGLAIAELPQMLQSRIYDVPGVWAGLARVQESVCSQALGQEQQQDLEVALKHLFEHHIAVDMNPIVDEVACGLIRHSNSMGAILEEHARRSLLFNGLSPLYAEVLAYISDHLMSDCPPEATQYVELADQTLRGYVFPVIETCRDTVFNRANCNHERHQTKRSFLRKLLSSDTCENSSDALARIERHLRKELLDAGEKETVLHKQTGNSNAGFRFPIIHYALLAFASSISQIGQQYDQLSRLDLDGASEYATLAQEADRLVRHINEAVYFHMPNVYSLKTA